MPLHEFDATCQLLNPDSHSTTNQTAGATMGTITIGARSFETPVLVPSISSFETQLAPSDALAVQNFLGEPISLVSAYDVARQPGSLLMLCKTFRERAVLLLDSGDVLVLEEHADSGVELPFRSCELADLGHPYLRIGYQADTAILSLEHCSPADARLDRISDPL